jgi:hypothetical protein
MDRACGTYGREVKIAGFWWGSLKERDHLEEMDAGGRIIIQ